jgi:GNAT superfamily N-acetyltransferase
VIRRFKPSFLLRVNQRTKKQENKAAYGNNTLGGENLMLTVRYASLEDVAAISEVHCSEIEQWKKGIYNELGVRERHPAPYEECSLVDRWEMGGPWMSVELCAIHINKMLLADQIVLVTELDDKVVAELELFIGDDDLYGYNANLSILYVHKNYQRKGVGTALLREAIKLARSLGCESLTTYDPEAPEFYERFGLNADRNMLKLTLLTGYGSPYEGSKIRCKALPKFSTLRKQKLLIGRILSSIQLHSLLTDEAAPGEYAISAVWREKRFSYSVTTANERYFVLFRDREASGQCATVFLWGATLNEAIIETVLYLATLLGFIMLQFVINQEDIDLFGSYTQHGITDTLVIHSLKLEKED